MTSPALPGGPHPTNQISPEDVEKQVQQQLAQPSSTLEDEVASLEKAYQIINDALQ